MSATDPVNDGFGPVVARPLSRIQQIVGQRLHAAWTQIPHVTHHEDADLTALESHRQAYNAAHPTAKLSPLAYVARAVARALKTHPTFCASLDPDGKTLWLKQYVHLGIAVETPKGLVVAVLPHADTKSLAELGLGIADLAARGRAGTLKPTEMEGSCFTVSSLGALGGVAFTPIINPPNVAILGLSQARVRPEWIDGAVQPRQILPMSMSYDHRVIDGADAARFCMQLRTLLADPDALTTDP
jgi:pyruvate dehydrogenase E2 component (dihydrolipoamide acetyltransferase)